MPIVATREISSAKEELIVIRTSDRMTFKRCRRLWGWTSHLRMGLRMKEEADYFWFGSGIHYSLEEFHGANVYRHPGKAFLAYVEATRKQGNAPSNWEEHVSLGLGIMSYYADYWLKTRDPLETFYVKGKPQLEINGYIDLGVKHKGKRVVYGFTLDRMIVDEHGQLFVGEYKTAKAFRLYHYDTDEQCTAYCWCASRLYEREISGVYYYQFKKQVPGLPRILTSGSVSAAANQSTTSALYRKQLIDIYGDLKIIPAANLKCLNNMVLEETEDQDKFIRRERIERNPEQVQTFEERVHMELEDLLNEDLPLYPNQTKDCSWSCPLQIPCIALESKLDYEPTLASYANHPSPQDFSWRKLLPKPNSVVLPPEAVLYKEMMEEIQQTQVQGDFTPQVTPEEAFLSEMGM